MKNRHWRLAYLLPISLASCAHVRLPAPVETHEAVPRPGLHVTSRTIYYAVRGGTVHEVREEMRRIGPLDDGAHQFAHTWGMYAWKYPYQQGPEGCRTGPVRVEVEIVFTFPEWVSKQSANADTVREWERWLAATKAHEDGHRNITLLTGDRIKDQLESVSAQSTCGELDRVANDLGSELLQKMRAQHAAYDHDTKHGKTTGAYLREDVP